MGKKILAFLMIFLMILSTFGGSVYAESNTFTGNNESIANEESIVIVGISKSKLENVYDDLNDEEIQDLLNSEAEFIFKNMENKETNFKLMRSRSKYSSMFDIKIIDGLNDEELTSDNGVVFYAPDTKPFSDTYYYVVRSTEGTGNYSVSASGTIFNGREASIERASGSQISGTWLGSPNPIFTPGNSSMWVNLRVKIIVFGISSGGYIYMK